MASPEPVSTASGLLAAGAWHQAEAAARMALAEDPSDLHALLMAGLAIAAMGEDARAAPILVQVAAMRPDAGHPCLDLALLQPPLPRGLIVRQFRACLGVAPDDDGLRLEFAGFLLDADRAADAAALLQDGPDTAAGYHVMGLIQAELGEFSAAISAFERAVALNPGAAASWSNLGMMLKIEGRFAEAVAAHDRAVALEPANHRFRVNRAVALLKMGHWERAWSDYESRLALSGAQLINPLRLMPALRPGDSLAGLTVAALHEDGFGDTLQFLRYLPLLAERGARVVACVPPALVRVIRMEPGVAEVVTDMGQLPPHDFVCPMFSLPRVFATTVETIPPVPVLTLDPAVVRSWIGRLPSGGVRAGLVWAGQARPSAPGFGTLDRRRSAGLDAFKPLFDVPGVTFVSLQTGPAARQTRSSGLALADLMPDVTDFADTAAIIAALDIVVSVDTSVVHLAGLLGKPVFLLDRYDGCWRWLSDRSDSPWYPGLTIFRQSRPGDWSGPMQRAAVALAGLCDSEAPAPMREQAFVA